MAKKRKGGRSNMVEPERIPNDPGARLAADMVENLRALNDRIEQSISVQAELRESVDQLVGHCEVFSRTMEILVEQADEGKNKWSLKDFAVAYLEAADEIMPAEDDEDEPGDEDPRVRVGD